MVVWVLAGYGCVGMGFGRVLCKWKGEKVSGKNILKNLLLPCLLHAQGRRSCTVPFKTAPCRFFFFVNKRKKFGSDPKMGYDSCPPLYNAYEAKTLRSKLVKKTKGKKMI
jgi:hypothetical protein